jgi:hypothetical protein
MDASTTAQGPGREITMKLAKGPAGQVLTATVPSDITADEFAVVGRQALGLVNRVTGCNCLSGLISVVIEDQFADVIRVDLGQKGVE